MTNNKVFKVEIQRKGRTNIVEDTLENLIQYFKYTLEVGHDYNNKVSCKPKTANSLVQNLNKAKSAATVNGFSDTYYSLINN